MLLAACFLIACSQTGPAATSTPDAVATLFTTLKTTPTPTPVALPHVQFSTRPVQRVWFYRPPANVPLDFLARSEDLFILTKQDASVRDELVRLGAHGPFLEYLSFDAIYDPHSCTADPLHNQVADRPGDFCTIARDHPDWFLRDGQGNLLYEDEGDSHYVLMDPSNAGWRNFWLDRARQSVEQGGWDGIFIDNVEASLNKRHKVGGIPAAYATDEAYQTAVQDFLRFIYTGYFGPQGHPLFANIIELQDPVVWFHYLENLDGVMDENFAVNWKGRYYSSAEWEQDLHRLEMAEQLGKRIVLVAPGSEGDLTREQFAFGSFLLIADTRATFRYTSPEAYEQAWVYDDWNLDLGAPLGPRYRVNAVWKRDFAHGSVIVDPAAHTAQISRR